MNSPSNYGLRLAEMWRKKSLVWASKVAYSHILKINDMEAATQKMHDALEFADTPGAIRHTLYTFPTLKHKPIHHNDRVTREIKRRGEEMFSTFVVPCVHTHISRDEKMRDVVLHSDLMDRLQLYFGPHFKVKYSSYKKDWRDMDEFDEEYLRSEYADLFDVFTNTIYLEFYYKPSQKMLDHIAQLAETYYDCVYDDVSGYVY